MCSEEAQNKYIASLEKKTIKYRAYLQDGTYYYISKLLYDGYKLIKELE
jgi:hypothetical protein